ncbi:MAG TPA: tRNA pseudouridine(55) synthase TruB [Gallionella sp.]|nr:tRNA pseudouridine(55) synthase TruB [Gallionella sp.]
MAKCIFRPLDGVLLFDKPLGLSSNTALQKVRRLFQAEKAGHTGTLDPLATGLLPICFGEATKFSNALLDADKTYRALLRLGQTTSTGDAEGDILSEHPVLVQQSDIDVVLAKFRGEIQQLPPMHSALKHHGKPLYEYIRKGETIERELREVVIHELVLNSFSGNEMDITVRCSKGTYIRTLAEDIGAALGCGAHLIGLRRTTIAHFDLRDAYSWQQLEAMTEAERAACILPLEALMPDIPVLQLDAVQIKRLAQGQKLGLDAGLPDGMVRLHGPQGFIGTGLLQGRRLAPERLLSGVAIQAAQADSAQNQTNSGKILGLSNTPVKG